MIHPDLSPQMLLRLHQAIDLWQARGARWVSLPWMAPASAIESTRPPGAGQDTLTPHGYLLASGEQAFLHLDAQGLLPEGSPLIGWTPCFRDEALFDETHHYYFVKAEVYQPLSSESHAHVLLEQLITTAQDVFEEIGGTRPVKVAMPQGQVDLEIAGVEVGSYGVRSRPNGKPYLYATALAEPRFSTALSLGSLRP